MGICALNSMLRQDKAGIRYKKEIENLMFEIKYDHKQIKTDKGASINMKLYLRLLSNKNCNDLFVN